MTDDYIYRDDAVSRMSELLVSELHMTRCPTWNEVYNAIGELPSADVVQVCRCKDCIHNNGCDIQYSAQAGDNFFCGFGETEKDVREDVYE